MTKFGTKKYFNKKMNFFKTNVYKFSTEITFLCSVRNKHCFPTMNEPRKEFNLGRMAINTKQLAPTEPTFPVVCREGNSNK